MDTPLNQEPTNSSERAGPVRGRDVAHAAARGAVAAMSMTGVRAVTGGMGIVDQIPPQAIFRQRAHSLLKRLPRRRRDAAIELAHWGYGAVGGAGYGLLPSRVRGNPLAGPAYGLLIWISFEVGIAPILGLKQARRLGRGRERLALAADHALYGLVLSEIRPAHKAAR